MAEANRAAKENAARRSLVFSRGRCAGQCGRSALVPGSGDTRLTGGAQGRTEELRQRRNRAGGANRGRSYQAAAGNLAGDPCPVEPAETVCHHGEVIGSITAELV